MASYFCLFYENLMKIKMIININKKIDNDKRYRNDRYCEKNNKWKRWKFVKRLIKNKVEKQKIKIKNELIKMGFDADVNEIRSSEKFSCLQHLFVFFTICFMVIIYEMMLIFLSFFLLSIFD